MKFINFIIITIIINSHFKFAEFIFPILIIKAKEFIYLKKLFHLLIFIIINFIIINSKLVTHHFKLFNLITIITNFICFIIELLIFSFKFTLLLNFFYCFLINKHKFEN
jgi:hypothetical protein